MVSRLPIVFMPLALSALLAGCAATGPSSSGSAASAGSATYAAGADSNSSTTADPDSYASMATSGSDCDAQPVQDMLGQAYGDGVGDTLRQRAGARAIRVLKPGQVMTMEYNPTRINIILDAKGAIEALRCG